MMPDHSVGEATYLARPPSSFPASNLGIIGANKPDTLFAITHLERVYLRRSRVLAGLFLHGKAVKQTVAPRADQCSLAATPGVVG
jgi:hypothetical protein